MGPILFLVYINDLLENFDDEIISFVDNTTFVCTGESWERVENDVNCKLRVVNNWLNEHKLLLNAEKTVCVIFTTYNNTKPNSLSFLLKTLKLKLYKKLSF